MADSAVFCSVSWPSRARRSLRAAVGLPRCAAAGCATAAQAEPVSAFADARVTVGETDAMGRRQGASLVQRFDRADLTPPAVPEPTQWPANRRLRRFCRAWPEARAPSYERPVPWQTDSCRRFPHGPLAQLGERCVWGLTPFLQFTFTSLTANRLRPTCAGHEISSACSAMLHPMRLLRHPARECRGVVLDPC